MIQNVLNDVPITLMMYRTHNKTFELQACNIHLHWKISTKLRSPVCVCVWWSHILTLQFFFNSFSIPKSFSLLFDFFAAYSIWMGDYKSRFQRMCSFIDNFDDFIFIILHTWWYVHFHRPATINIIIYSIVFMKLL